MIDTAFHFEEICTEDRDEIFINRLLDCIEQLEAIGITGKQLKRTLGSFDFVKFWCGQIKDCYPAKNLPKGYKWADGKKYSVKGGKKSISETYVFLPVGDDLYIKGYYLVGMNYEKHKPMFRVKNFRKKTARELLEPLMYEPFFSSCIVDFWHAQGLRQGLVEPVLREWRGGVGDER